MDPQEAVHGVDWFMLVPTAFGMCNETAYLRYYG